MPLLPLLILACGGPARPGTPSIVLISLDTVRADHMRLYGGRAGMPTVEEFARKSVVFEKAYSHFPQTQQSHWTLFTSTLPEVHRRAADDMDTPYRGLTLAEHLASQGYTTGAFIGGMTLTAEASGMDRGFGVYDDDGTWGIDQDLRPAAEVRGAAEAWMGAQDGPFFAFVHFFDAHSPYAPADPSRYDPDYTGPADGSLAAIRREWARPWMSPRDIEHVVALYDAELTELDAEVGALLASLPADAVVAITADHGESFSHGYLFNHPEVVYDSVLHVPLVVRAPGVAPRREPAQVGLVDVAPTLLQAAGLPPLPEAVGRVLLPTTPPETVLYARSRAPNQGKALLAARTPAVKAVFEEGGGEWAFDLAADPDEGARVAIPAALADADERYRAAVANDLSRWPPLAPAAPDAGMRARLEALGYAAPDAPGSAPGAHPPGPPNPGPVGPPNPSGPPNPGAVGPPNAGGNGPPGAVGPPNAGGNGPPGPASPSGAPAPAPTGPPAPPR